jgi:hypothetical protein
MKTTSMAIAAMVCAAIPLLAQEKPADTEAAARTEMTWENPAWWQTPPKVLPVKPNTVIGGPLVEGFRYVPKAESEPQRTRSFVDNFSSVPILNLFVPQPMPVPPRSTIKYFAWGQRDLAWSTIVDRPIPGPVGVLVSANR